MENNRLQGQIPPEYGRMAKLVRCACYAALRCAVLCLLYCTVLCLLCRTNCYAAPLHSADQLALCVAALATCK